MYQSLSHDMNEVPNLRLRLSKTFLILCEHVVMDRNRIKYSSVCWHRIDPQLSPPATGSGGAVVGGEGPFGRGTGSRGFTAGWTGLIHCWTRCLTLQTAKNEVSEIFFLIFTEFVKTCENTWWNLGDHVIC